MQNLMIEENKEILKNNVEMLYKRLENDDFRRRFVAHFNLPFTPNVSYKELIGSINFLQTQLNFNIFEIAELIEHDCAIASSMEPKDESALNLSYEEVHESIIKFFKRKKEWKCFETKSAPTFKQSLFGSHEKYANHVKGFYNEENVSKYFVSIDLKSANWQSLKKFFNINQSFEEFISSFTDYKLPLTSKAFRAKMGGKISQRNILSWNKYNLLNSVGQMTTVFKEHANVELCIKNIAGIYADEIIFEVSLNDFVILNKINRDLLSQILKDKTGFSFHIEPFKLIKFNNTKIYVKVGNNGKYSLKYASKQETLFWYKLWSGWINIGDFNVPEFNNIIELNSEDYEPLKVKQENQKIYRDNVEIQQMILLNELDKINMMINGPE